MTLQEGRYIVDININIRNISIKIQIYSSRYIRIVYGIRITALYLNMSFRIKGTSIDIAYEKALCLKTKQHKNSR